MCAKSSYNIMEWPHRTRTDSFKTAPWKILALENHRRLGVNRIAPTTLVSIVIASHLDKVFISDKRPSFTNLYCCFKIQGKSLLTTCFMSSMSFSFFPSQTMTSCFLYWESYMNMEELTYFLTSNFAPRTHIRSYRPPTFWQYFHRSQDHLHHMSLTGDPWPIIRLFKSALLVLESLV